MILNQDRHVRFGGLGAWGGKTPGKTRTGRGETSGGFLETKGRMKGKMTCKLDEYFSFPLKNELVLESFHYENFKK